MHTKTPIVRLQGAVNAVCYQNDILLPLVIPHSRANRGMILAQDNAPCHSVCTTQQLLGANNVRRLDWPAKSPDLNPIEHVLDLLKRHVRQLRQYRTLGQLQHDVNQIWTNYSELHLLYATTMSSRDTCEWWSYQVLERHESLKATYVNLETRGTGTFLAIE